ncbi:electron transfer flavoprotein subunit beta/FixA family protein [Peptoniphilus mikwangii]|uniref:electron transfer flavoprotein subunit beta/FixA family protein n=1 Tax=Peptoniphilus mikwangii TaxID=1354300 RepID=UPI0003F851A8|nr:electron transfer flavoprotein subunit beta/FixA family protein [Peptoniphilus mikwangii]
MKYLVCIKQVPKINKVSIDPITKNLIRDGIKTIINPADVNALTLALKLKSQTGGSIAVLTMGPPQAIDSVKECIAMGADEGYILSGREFSGADTLATSYSLYKAIEYIGNFDVVLTGDRTLDGDTAQVGSEIAEFLNFNQATFIKDANFKDGYFQVVRKLSDKLEKQNLRGKVLFTVIKDANEPVNIRKKDMEMVDESKIKIIGSKDIGADLEKIGTKGSPTMVLETFSPKEHEKGFFLEGTNEKMVDKLIEILKNEGFAG